eukprot:SAG11_NODE_10023_length_862_cov_1.099607_1_plen_152_part_01
MPPLSTDAVRGDVAGLATARLDSYGSFGNASDAADCTSVHVAVATPGPASKENDQLLPGGSDSNSSRSDLDTKGWSRSCVWSYIETVLWSTAWVSANVFLTLYNKWGFQRNYSVPVFLTSFHCFLSFLVAYIRSFCFPVQAFPIRDVLCPCV